MVYYIRGPGAPVTTPGPRISVIEGHSQTQTAGFPVAASARLLALTGIAAYPLLMLVQGIDFTDMGFNLSNQWLLLENAGSYRHGHLFYLSNLLGGLWLAATQPLGLLGAKLGWALVIYATVYAAYRCLQPCGGRGALLAGLVIAVLWNTRVGATWISYNELTALFFTCAALALTRGLTGDRVRLVALAGVLLGASIFLRFPNLTAFALVALIPLLARLSARDRRWTLRHGGGFILGYAAGVVAILVLMAALGHLPLYLESLDARFAASATDEKYLYSSDRMVAKLVLDYENLVVMVAVAVPLLLLAARALAGRWYWQLAGLVGVAYLWYLLLGWGLVDGPLFFTGLLALVLVFAAAFWLRRIPDGSPLQIVPFVVGTLLLLWLAVLVVSFRWTWVVPGALLVVLGFRYWRRREPEDRLVTAAAAMLLIITPLGSGNGMINAIYGMWLAIPLGVMTLVDAVRAAAGRPWYRRAALVVTVAACGGVLLVGLTNVAKSAYRDSKDRSRMTAYATHPYLRGVLTTPERAVVTDQLLAVLPEFVAPGEPLLLLGDCPLLHLLSGTRPVLGSTWNGVYNENIFDRRFRAFEESAAERPVVLMGKGSCRDREWPTRIRITPAGFHMGKEVHRYMSEHGYRLRWQNAFFEIWVPGVNE